MKGISAKVVAVALATAVGVGACGASDRAVPRSSAPAPAADPSTTAVPVATTSTTSTTSTRRYPPTTQPAPDPGTVATSPEVGWPADWELDPAYEVYDTDRAIHIRLFVWECADGREQEPLRAGVRQVDGELRITVDLAPLPRGTFGAGHTCPDVRFPAVVELDGPIDGRPIVNARCLLGGTRAGPNPHDLCIVRPGR